MQQSSPLLIAVVGPTAIGKTVRAIQLAEHYNTEILSADSRQFYKEMSIGTAVPTKEELSLVKHHFIQHISIDKPYSVGDFERDAMERLDALFTENKVAVLVGGSGLYVQAVLDGLDEFPDVAPGIREEINALYREKGIEELQRQLKQLDPEYYKQVDLQNPHRLIRALEICISSGQSYSSFRNNKKAQRPFEIIMIGLEADREIVYDRINRRVDLMMEEGLLSEVKSLHPKKDLNALQTVGYQELFSYLDGQSDLDMAISEIKKNSRRFAKRQFTWFRRDPRVSWFDYQVDIQVIIDHIQKKTAP
ncbi:tRNA (adenosine(37)-N6)-dimethylallyltransferase MiaA [Aureitalea marina]|uniref:tRNA dimethylallyltransferase n=2 Tax=Aureitalea marina TaxID=930804 RepID=A0A2S7KN65_9FLAO|nr:tRNA (adenosine(37)-N6)-dimethylallyltransferase MiaA [Aureitalea marina]